MMILVMIVKYIIYEYAAGMEKLFEQYPHLKGYFDSLTLDNKYMVQLMECAYKNVDYLNDVIYNTLSKRQEYHRIGHLHIFENQLTHEIIRLEVKNYAIEVESKDKNNIFFDILYHNLKSYVIIDENL